MRFLILLLISVSCTDVPSELLKDFHDFFITYPFQPLIASDFPNPIIFLDLCQDLKRPILK